MTEPTKRDREKARNIALKWAQGKEISLKHVGYCLPDLIAKALAEERESMRKRAVEEIKHFDEVGFYNITGIKEAIQNLKVEDE